MQTTMQTLVSQTAFAAARPAVRASRRSTLVVRASSEAESRRAVLGGLLAGAAALTAGRANAGIDLFDDRKARENGFDIIYEARDLDLPQAQRDGLSQYRANLDATKARIDESAKRISTLETPINKKYWTEAREELRRQVGTLRFDLNAVADTLPKPAKLEALAAKKDFFSAVDVLDLAMKKKDQESALSAYSDVLSKFETVKAKLG